MPRRRPVSSSLPEPARAAPVAPAADRARHRSGAVARMLQMPVATLRVWERRYGVARPERSPSGQRLYSAADVRRLALLRQLTERGHAIGSLAGLDMAQLQRVAATHAQSLATVGASVEPAALAGPAPWRLLVVGEALARRLRVPALAAVVGRPVELLGPYASLAEAAATVGEAAVDALVCQEAQLQAGWLEAAVAAAPRWSAVPRAAFYGFAADSVVQTLGEAGVWLLRAPQPDAVLLQWLRGIAGHDRPPEPLPATDPQPVPPRRWDDAALADVAGLSTTMACECPRHVAELLVQLSHFEAYSAACESRSPADAELHAYLKTVSGRARAAFEAALERVALHDGLILPVRRGAA